MSAFDLSKISNVRGRIEGRIINNGELTEKISTNIGGSIDSARLLSYDKHANKIVIRLDHREIPSFWIEIPLDLSQLSEWIENEKERLEIKEEIEEEKNIAIDMGIYDIGQDEGELNWLGKDTSA
jgi:hypothetical protein